MSTRTLTGGTFFFGMLCSVLAACSSKEGASLPYVPPPTGGPSLTDGQGTGGAAGSTPSFLTEVDPPEPLLSVPIGGTGSGGAANPGSASNEAQAGRTVTENCASSKASAVDLTEVRPADIIFAIDASSSMGEEIGFVQENMNRFSEQIIASGIDVHVILLANADPPSTGMTGTGGMGAGGRGGFGGPIVGGGLTPGRSFAVCIGAPLGSGTCPADTNLPNYVHVNLPVGSNDALSQIVNSYPQWREHLRAEATKSFVVITDDDATDRPINNAQLFDMAIRQADATMFAEYTFNGVFSFTDCPEAFEIGNVYKQLVANTQGVSGDLCEQDFQPVFDRLAEQIIQTAGSTITCEWELPPAPTGQAFSSELVEVERTTANGALPLSRVAAATDCGAGGWHLDSTLNPTKILACPNTCTEMQNQSGGKIDITFGCEALSNCIATGTATVSSSAPGACDWAIPEPPPGQSIDFKSVNLRYTSPSGFASNLGNVSSAAACASVEHGWYYDDATNPKRLFSCPQTCSEVQAGSASAKVEVLFGCDTVPAILK